MWHKVDDDDDGPEGRGKGDRGGQGWKGEREPETKRKGASAVIGRSIRPLPTHGYLIFCNYLYVKPQAFVCTVRAPTYKESIGMRRGE